MRKGETEMKKFFAILMAALMVAAMFAGCGEAGTTSESNAIKIGMTGPLTGGASAYGIAVRAGMEIAVEEINAKGGLQIEFRSEDDEADGSDKAVSAYNVSVTEAVSASGHVIPASAFEVYAAKYIEVTGALNGGENGFFRMP